MATISFTRRIFFKSRNFTFILMKRKLVTSFHFNATNLKHSYNMNSWKYTGDVSFAQCSVTGKIISLSLLLFFFFLRFQISELNKRGFGTYFFLHLFCFFKQLKRIADPASSKVSYFVRDKEKNWRFISVIREVKSAPKEPLRFISDAK